MGGDASESHPADAKALTPEEKGVDLEWGAPQGERHGVDTAAALAGKMFTVCITSLVLSWLIVGASHSASPHSDPVVSCRVTDEVARMAS